MMRHAREERKPMKKAVNAIKRFPFCLVTVSVDPIIGPRDQFIQVPMCTSGPVPVFAGSMLGSRVLVGRRWRSKEHQGTSIPPFPTVSHSTCTYTYLWEPLKKGEVPSMNNSRWRNPDAIGLLNKLDENMTRSICMESILALMLNNNLTPSNEVGGFKWLAKDRRAWQL